MDDDERRALLVEAQIELRRRQARRDPWTTLILIIAASVVWFVAGLLTAKSYWHPSPQEITVRIEGGLPRQ